MPKKPKQIERGAGRPFVRPVIRPSVPFSGLPPSVIDKSFFRRPSLPRSPLPADALAQSSTRCGVATCTIPARPHSASSVRTYTYTGQLRELYSRRRLVRLEGCHSRPTLRFHYQLDLSDPPSAAVPHCRNSEEAGHRLFVIRPSASFVCCLSWRTNSRSSSCQSSPNYKW